MPRPARTATLPPQIDSLYPGASLPGGEVELFGSNLGPRGLTIPAVEVDGFSANLLLSRSSRLGFTVPERATVGIVEVRTPDGPSNSTQLRIARQLSDGLHPVTSPVVSRSGMTFATISGPRGKQTPVSIVRISPDRVGTPFVSGILNPTGLAFDPDGVLYVTAPSLSPHDCVWAIDRDGSTSAWFRGLGRPQGLALDSEENIYVAASFRGRRGIVRVTQDGHAELVVSGHNLVGLAFSPLGTAVLATNEAVYDVDLGVEALRLF